MKERPIIFSGPMVRAILEGRKTQTRRVVKPQPPEKYELTGIPCAKIGGIWTWDFHDGIHFNENWGPEFSAKCPYGQPGDLLYCKETWAHIWECEPPDPTELPEALDSMPWHIEYKADSEAKYPGDWPEDEGDNPDCAKWKSSRFMFKKYARLWLRITNVRVERLQEISAEDVCREGIRPTIPGGFEIDECHWIGEQQFRPVWDPLNAKRGYSWESNPWCWVVEFERAKP